jgi:hypothetical protein
MERAGDLLETSFLSVKEIAHAVGLNDESHFVRDFKTIYGVTPTRYRTLLVGTHPNESTAVFDARSKIRQRIAKAANRMVLPSLNTFIYIVTFISKGTEVLTEVGKIGSVTLW